MVAVLERFNCSKKRRNSFKNETEFSARFLLLPAQSSSGTIEACTEDKAQSERISSLTVMVFFTSIKQLSSVWGIGRVSWWYSLQRNPAKPAREIFSRPMARFVGAAAKMLARYPKQMSLLTG